MELLKVSSISCRVIKIMLSVSVLSLLFSFLPFLFQSLTQFSINKSYVFLFCNGLMAFIAKNSSLPSYQFNDLDVAAPVHNSQEHDMAAADSAEQQQEEEEEEEKRVIVASTYSQEGDEVIADTEEEEEEAEEEEEEEEEERIIVADVSQEEEDQARYNGVSMTEEAEEEEEVEELNKKCEDFIRKMRAAFCSEPFYHHTSAMVTTVR